MSEDKLMELFSAGRRRGMVQASITRLENCVDMYEIKEELAHADHLVILLLIKKFEMMDAEFC